ncbi:MAG: hypothetical protein E7588_05700 [Ruminococcaceae bacterium]|nr:hypothetical protein [Oscillospiraceae bacterium]
MRQQNRENRVTLIGRVKSLMNKFKNKERYKNAAYYTLSSESYSPGFVSLFLCFCSSGLGVGDSFFNALYMYVSEKDRHTSSKMKKRYGDVVSHPCGYSENSCKSTGWAVMLKVLNFIPKLHSLPSRFKAARLKRRADSENSFIKFINIADSLRRRACYIFPAVMALVVGVYIFNATSERVVLNVFYDGKDMGTVESKKMMEDVLRAVEDNLSESTGVAVKLSNNITYSASKTADPNYVSGTVLYADIMAEAKKDYTTAYGLYIDGTFVAPLEDKQEIQTVLNEITGDGSEIANGIQILRQDYPQDAIKSSDELKEMLGRGPENMVLSAQPVPGSGNVETAPVVIRNIPAPVSNDSVDFSNAYAIEDEKILEISYKTEIYEEKTVEEEFTTVYEYNSNMYTTSKYVKQQGKNGTKRITEKVVYVNGKEESRTVVGEEVVKATVDKIIVKGLKPVPESAPDDIEKLMVWPIDGNVDEPYGWRLRDHSYMEYHNGIDMRAPRGTPILAAASGVVEKAGNYHNGYGKMVIIRHPDGKETFYAHMNDIYVSVGDIVAQGTIIGEVGSTGDSTGNHIHFEVRMGDGTSRNPLDYLVPKGE